MKFCITMRGIQGVIRILGLCVLGLVVACGSGMVKQDYMELEKNAPIRPELQKGNRGRIGNIVFSPDGNFFASNSEQNIKLWKADGTLMWTSDCWSQYSSSVAFFSPDGKYIIRNGSNYSYLWRLDGTMIKQLENGDSKFVIHDNEVFIASRKYSTLAIMKIDGTILKEFSIGTYSYIPSPDGELFAAPACAYKDINLWSFDGKLKKTLTGATAEIDEIKFSPEGQFIVSRTKDKKMYIWRRNGTLVKILFSPDGDCFITQTNCQIDIWSKNGNHVKTLKNAYCITFSPDGDFFASELGGTVKIWNTSGSVRKSFYASDGGWDGLYISPDGKIIITKRSHRGNNVIKLWRTDGTSIGTISTKESANIATATFSPDGKLFSCGLYDGSMMLCKPDGTLVKNISGDQNYIYNVAINPDGKSAATCGYDNTVKLWRFGGSQVKTLKGHSDFVSCVASVLMENTSSLDRMIKR